MQDVGLGILSQRARRCTSVSGSKSAILCQTATAQVRLRLQSSVSVRLGDASEGIGSIAKAT